MSFCMDVEYRFARSSTLVMNDLYADHILQGRGETQRQQRLVDRVPALLQPADRGKNSQCILLDECFVYLGSIVRLHARPHFPISVGEFHRGTLDYLPGVG